MELKFARRCLLASAHVTLLQGLFSKIFISSMANVAVVGVITQGLGCRRVKGYTRVYLPSSDGYNLRTQEEITRDAKVAFTSQKL